MELPNCRAKIATSVEMAWNYIEPDEEDGRARRRVPQGRRQPPDLRVWETSAGGCAV